MAYAGKSAGGAQNVTLIVELDGQEYRETVYVSNRKGENYFYSKDRDGKPSTNKSTLPGFTVVDHICLLTTGLPLCEQDDTVEEKMVKIYDFEAKKEVPKSVPVLTGLLGKQISLGIIKTWENKTQKQGDEYVAIADTKFTNAIDKVFHTETKRTVSEIKAEAETGAFWGAWLERNKDVTRDKRSIKDGEAGAGTAGRPGSRASSAPPVAGAVAAGGAPRKSLFGAKA
jgi:hypothetical protein